MCGQWWVSARLVSSGAAQHAQTTRWIVDMAASTRVGFNLHGGAKSFHSARHKKRQLGPIIKSCLCQCPIFCHWLNAVMCLSRWSLRPNAFRKWHFTFNNTFYFVSLTADWCRTVVKGLFRLLVSFNEVRHLSPLLGARIQNGCFILLCITA